MFSVWPVASEDPLADSSLWAYCARIMAKYPNTVSRIPETA